MPRSIRIGRIRCAFRGYVRSLQQRINERKTIIKQGHNVVNTNTLKNNKNKKKTLTKVFVTWHFLKFFLSTQRTSSLLFLRYCRFLSIVFNPSRTVALLPISTHYHLALLPSIQNLTKQLPCYLATQLPSPGNSSSGLDHISSGFEPKSLPDITRVTSHFNHVNLASHFLTSRKRFSKKKKKL